MTTVPTMSPADKLAAGLLLTDNELAALLGTSPQTVRNWRWKGIGPRYVRLGDRLIRYRPDDIQAFIEGKEGAA